MRCLVTGAAGFIGSHLCERLLRDGHEVIGVDAFIPYYPRPIKEANLAECGAQPCFSFHELDLRHDALDAVTTGIDVVYHLAAMAGLPKSWTDFELYDSCNLIATQRLLESAGRNKSLTRFVYASTSSVYGRYATGDEMMPARPISPYGVTKLAAENLCRAHADERGLPLTVLRYFSVYGPRQRPDMGYHKFIQAMIQNEPIAVCGDGHQSRGNTYIDDCIEATVRAVQSPRGEVYNIGGGETATVWDIIRILERLMGKRAITRNVAAREGDQRHTGADTGKLERHLDWQPTVGLNEGLARQIAWQRQATVPRVAA
jgi:nucleoside-diphosphate-sugar epimerase